MLIDTHCHLDLIEDAPGALDRAEAAGVSQVITIGVDLASSLDAVARAAGDARVFATVGLHPHDARLATDELWTTIRDLASNERCVGIGEAGLDYHYDHSPRDTQRAVFERQVELAAETGKTLVIHTRDAWPDTWAILDAGPRVPTVFHCFSGGPAEAERAVAGGAVLSFSGVVTFKNAADLRAAAQATPLDHLVVETDSPFLAPVPHRGRPNEPAHVAITAAFLADLLEVDREAFSEATTATARKAFGLPSP